MAEQSASLPGADTRVWLAVHKTFRLATDRFVAATERLEPSVLEPLIGTRWSFYTSVLDHHHHTEDDSIFPALIAANPEMKDLIAELEDDHRRLIDRMTAVDEAVASFEKHPDLPNRQAVRDAVVALRDEFFPHLDVEDARVVPAVAQSVPPAEWKRIDNEALRTIPRKWLPMAVGALDEVIRSLPEAERPPPPPLPIRVMLALSWRKKWADWIRPTLA